MIRQNAQMPKRAPLSTRVLSGGFALSLRPAVGAAFPSVPLAKMPMFLSGGYTGTLPGRDAGHKVPQPFLMKPDGCQAFPGHALVRLGWDSLGGDTGFSPTFPVAVCRK